MSSKSKSGSPKVSNSLDLLAPQFAEAVRKAIEECNSAQNKLDAMVYEGYRSQELQKLYYARGRTVIPPKHTVTNAPTNQYSWHGYGLAVDVVHKTKYWEPDEGDNWFAKVADIFKKHGCKWGGDWKKADPPHMQWGRCKASPSDEARQLLATAGVESVWKAVAAD